jgi:hypothetical protein
VAIVDLAWIHGNGLTRASLDNAAAAQRAMRAVLDHADAELVMRMAWK